MGKMHQKHTGSRNELRAVCWLLDNGYEVFRNVSQHGPADLITIDADGGIRLIDVKTILALKEGCPPPVTEAQRHWNIWLLAWDGQKFHFFDPADPNRSLYIRHQPRSLAYTPPGGWLSKEDLRGIA